MTARIVVAAAIVVVAAAIAWWLQHHGRVAAPTQGRAVVPQQLDRRDFVRPDAPWLVVLFTSRQCESCAGLLEKAQPLSSEQVAVMEVEYGARPDLHRRYEIDAAPITVIADADGVTRASFIGAFAAPELWDALAQVRAGSPGDHPPG